MKDLGKLLKDEHGYGIMLERIYNHPVEKVWDALTDPAKMTIWFLKAEWDFRPGGKIKFTFPDEHQTETYGRFTAIEPFKLMEFIWHNDDGNPDELARWELFDESDTTRLVLTYTRVRESLAASVSTGWHIVLNDFSDFLDGKREFRQSTSETDFTDEQKVLKGEYETLFNQL